MSDGHSDTALSKAIQGRIFFICGVSAAGKSTIARALAEKYSVPLVELDHYHSFLMEQGLEKTPPFGATRNLVDRVIRMLLSTHAGCIAEGVWSTPIQAHQLRMDYGDRLQPLFCGYPNADPELRRQVVIEGGRHWLKYWLNTRPGDIAKWLVDQKASGRAMEIECRELGVPFVDMSDFTEGGREVEHAFRDFLADGSGRGP